jgi:hypothetical protein
MTTGPSADLVTGRAVYVCDKIGPEANPTVRGIHQWSKQSFQHHHPGGVHPPLIF